MEKKLEDKELQNVTGGAGSFVIGKKPSMGISAIESEDEAAGIGGGYKDTFIEDKRIK